MAHFSVEIMRSPGSVLGGNQHLQFFCHPGAAVATQAQSRLLLDVRQNHHVHVQPAAGRAAAESPQPVGADIHRPTQPVYRESPALFFNEPEPHGFWLAKNWVVGSTGQRRAVEVVDRPMLDFSRTVAGPEPAVGTIEIDTTCGYRLRISGAYDPAALARLIHGLSG